MVSKMENKAKTTREVEEFFRLRFPDKDLDFEKKCGYFQKWVTRFESDSPEVFMDHISKKVYALMLRDKTNKLDNKDEEDDPYLCGRG